MTDEDPKRVPLTGLPPDVFPIFTPTFNPETAAAIEDSYAGNLLCAESVEALFNQSGDNDGQHLGESNG